MAVSFDLFGTLVDVDRSSDPAAAVAAALSDRGVDVPDDWASAYRERHIDAPDGAAVPLPAHVSAALASRGVDAPGTAVRRAVVSAFDPAVETRDGAVEAVRAAADHGPVGVLSNCSVPHLASRVLTRSAVDRELLDATVTSIGCGWRKPDRRAFAAAARALDVLIDALYHVGDDPRTDGQVLDRESTADAPDTAGPTHVLLEDVPLHELPAYMEGRAWD
ncbi:HAD family hydrolase [Halorientalis sp. IM1011]|uniref:HAD family hydrolase n=1 Tax=Halorientalis sp. IM1011 TaxID=1932360 RepID=UPI00097CCB6E|nr:HAD family hydrolase [Halorientalis sp. IM1011]AQL42058.1 HAD family hydrolase [Halorientalis sp. IM1011]